MRFSCFSVLQGILQKHIKLFEVWHSNTLYVFWLLTLSVTFLPKISKPVPMSQSYSNPKVGRFLKHGVFYSDPGVIYGGLIRFCSQIWYWIYVIWRGLLINMHACCSHIIFLVHGQVAIIFVVSVCLFVCLCRVFLSCLWSDFDQTWTYVICLGLVVSPRI